jgi:hypothetical protein
VDGRGPKRRAFRVQRQQALKGFLEDARRGGVKVEVADVPPQTERLVRKVLEEVY